MPETAVPDTAVPETPATPTATAAGATTLDLPLDVPAERRFVSVREDEARFIHSFVAEHGFERTLEIGFAFGFSAAHILAASRGPHVVMDPYQSTTWENLGVRNIERCGFTERLEMHEDFSYAVLPRLLEQERQFDFAFIDGDHRYEGVFCDFIQVDRLLEQGGLVLFHDTWMRPIQLVANYIRTNRDDYVERDTGLRNLVMFEKRAEVVRDWFHFREFYTWKSLLRHRLTAWRVHGRDTVLKRAVLGLRNALRRRG